MGNFWLDLSEEEEEETTACTWDFATIISETIRERYKELYGMDADRQTGSVEFLDTCIRYKIITSAFCSARSSGIVPPLQTKREVGGYNGL